MKKADKIQVLEMLRKLVVLSQRSVTQPDDPSGINTTYLMDQDRMLEAIDAEIKELDQ